MRRREPPQPHLASATLPAAGAWTSQAAYAIPPGTSALSFLVEYTGASAAGAVKYRVEKGYSATTLAPEQVTDTAMSVSSSSALRIFYDAEMARPTSGTTATSFAVDINPAGGWTHIRISMAEHGDTAAPGTASVTLAASA